MNSDSSGVGAPEHSPCTPRVSVVIPAFNAEQTIERAVASAMAQTLPAHEIIVVDDASSDNTVRALESIGASAVIVRRLANNVGAAAARNHGVQEASGSLIAFLDADDEWLPTKLEVQVALMAANPRCVLVSCDTLAVPLSSAPVRMHDRCKPVRGPDAWRALLVENFIPTPTVLARRSDILAVGGFDPKLVIGEDLDLWIRLAERGDVEFSPEILVRTHQRRGSLMRSHPTADADMVLPMIAGHLTRLGQRLDREERRQILGHRHFSVAYDLYRKQHRAAATRHALHALRLGHRRLRSISIVLRAAIPWALPARKG